MTVTVSQSTIIENVYKNFYDLVVAIGGIFATKVYPSFPDIVEDAVADYPIVVIGSPDIGWDTFTFGKNLTEGTIAIDVYTNTPKDTDQYSSDISNQIEVSKDTFSSIGLRQVNLEGTNSNMFPQGKIKVFIKTLIFNYKFYSDKTFAY